MDAPHASAARRATSAVPRSNDPPCSAMNPYPARNSHVSTTPSCARSSAITSGPPARSMGGGPAPPGLRRGDVGREVHEEREDHDEPAEPGDAVARLVRQRP